MRMFNFPVVEPVAYAVLLFLLAAIAELLD